MPATNNIPRPSRSQPTGITKSTGSRKPSVGSPWEKAVHMRVTLKKITGRNVTIEKLERMSAGKEPQLCPNKLTYPLKSDPENKIINLWLEIDQLGGNWADGTSMMFAAQAVILPESPYNVGAIKLKRPWRDASEFEASLREQDRTQPTHNSVEAIRHIRTGNKPAALVSSSVGQPAPVQSGGQQARSTSYGSSKPAALQSAEPQARPVPMQERLYIRARITYRITSSAQLAFQACQTPGQSGSMIINERLGELVKAKMVSSASRRVPAILKMPSPPAIPANTDGSYTVSVVISIKREAGKNDIVTMIEYA